MEGSAPARGARRRIARACLAAVVALTVLVVARDAPSRSHPAHAAACSPAFGAFRVGAWPPACWRPYAASSPFNRPVPASPPVLPGSAGIVRRLLTEFGPMESFTVERAAGMRASGGPATYYAQPSDPEFVVRTRLPYGHPPRLRIRIPAGARPERPHDAHMTVIDQARHREVDLYQVGTPVIPRRGGTLEVGWAAVQPIGTARADGLTGGRARPDGGAGGTAAGWSQNAGLIRGAEMAAGRIGHALEVVVHCDSGRHVYPAHASGLACRSIGLPATDAPALGTRLWLDLGAARISRIAGLAFWQRTILVALHRYGAFVGDTTEGRWAIEAENGRTYTSFGYEDPFQALSRRYAGRSRISFWAGDARHPAAWYWSGGNAAFTGVLRRHLRVLEPCVSRGACRR